LETDHVCLRAFYACATPPSSRQRLAIEERILPGLLQNAKTA
jgi:hypothetical protein